MAFLMFFLIKASERRYFTRVNDPVDLDAGVVQLFGEGVNSLQQVFTRLWVDVGPPGRDLDWTVNKRVTSPIKLGNPNFVHALTDHPSALCSTSFAK